MTFFISKNHILLILKLIWTIFVTLNVLNVKPQKKIDAERQQGNDQRSWTSNYILVLLA
jgi:hypothetical protein